MATMITNNGKLANLSRYASALWGDAITKPNRSIYKLLTGQLIEMFTVSQSNPKTEKQINTIPLKNVIH
jgi:hypothetical protein